MGIHNDFGRDASRESTTLKTGYKFIKTQTAVLQYLQKMKTTLSTRVLTEAVSSNPSASHYKLKEFVDSL